MSQFFDLRCPADEHVFFPEISSMFLELPAQYFCSVILVSTLVTDPFLFGFIAFFLFLYAMFHIFVFNFFTCLVFSMNSKISLVVHFCFVFLSIRGICSTAASVTITLNFTHCWSTSSGSVKT